MMVETTAADGLRLRPRRSCARSATQVGPTVAEVQVPLDPADYPDRLARATRSTRTRSSSPGDAVVTARAVAQPFHYRPGTRPSTTRARADLLGGRDERDVLAEVVGRRADAFARSGAARRGRSRSSAPRSRRASCACRRPARRRSRCAAARSCSATCLRGAGSRCPTSRRRSRSCAGGGSLPSTSSTRRRRCSRRSTPTAASRGCPSSARPSSSSCGRRRGTGPTSTSCRRPSSDAPSVTTNFKPGKRSNAPLNSRCAIGRCVQNTTSAR